jgi:hypothetical protein
MTLLYFSYTLNFARLLHLFLKMLGNENWNFIQRQNKSHENNSAMFEVGLGARKSTHRLNIDIVNPFTFLKKKKQYCDSILGLYLNKVRFQLIYRY